jgi:hypothetical protein
LYYWATASCNFARVLTEKPLSPTRTKAIAAAIQTIRLFIAPLPESDRALRTTP